MIEELNQRSGEILRNIVEAYVESGEPISSRTLARRLGMNLSAASIRNVMADLEEMGLLFSRHTSAGRLPTEAGLRFFVDGLLEIGDLSNEERANIDLHCSASGRSVEELLTEATSMLSGLSDCAGLVVAPKQDATLKQIEFVGLSPRRALVVMVCNDGSVENRVIDVPGGVTATELSEATNYLTTRLAGRTLEQGRHSIQAELEAERVELDELTGRVVEAGLATWAGDQDRSTLIVRGQAKLLEDVSAIEDLERIRVLFDALETKKGLLRLIELTGQAEGVRIFIGSENELFGLAGCSIIVAPYVKGRDHIVGAIGVIGPTRLNYGRIIPMVDYTAKVIGRLIAGESMETRQSP